LKTVFSNILPKKALPSGNTIPSGSLVQVLTSFNCLKIGNHLHDNTQSQHVGLCLTYSFVSWLWIFFVNVGPVSFSRFVHLAYFPVAVALRSTTYSIEYFKFPLNFV
jgi:hypothetical protein